MIMDKISEDYLKIIQDCSFSGLILVNKTETINQLMTRLANINLDILDNCNYYMNLGNNILIQNFKNLIQGKIDQNNEDSIYNEILNIMK